MDQDTNKELDSSRKTFSLNDREFVDLVEDYSRRDYFPARQVLYGLFKGEPPLKERPSEDLQKLEKKLRKSSDGSLRYGMLGEEESLTELLEADEKKLKERFPELTPRELAERMATLLSIAEYTRDARKANETYKTAYLPDDAPESLRGKTFPVEKLKELFESTGMPPEQAAAEAEKYVYKIPLPGYGYDSNWEQAFALPSGTRLLLRVNMTRGAQMCPLEHDCKCAGGAMVQIVNLSNGKQLQTGDLFVHFAAMGFFEGEGVPEFRVDPVEMAEILGFDSDPKLEPIDFKEIKDESINEHYKGFSLSYDMTRRLRETGDMAGNVSVSTWVTFDRTQVENPPGSFTRYSSVDNPDRPPRKMLAEIFGDDPTKYADQLPFTNPNTVLAQLDDQPFNAHGYRFIMHEGTLIVEVGEKPLDPKEFRAHLKEEGIEAEINTFGNIGAHNIGIFTLEKKSGYIPQIEQNADATVVLK